MTARVPLFPKEARWLALGSDVERLSSRIAVFPLADNGGLEVFETDTAFRVEWRRRAWGGQSWGEKTDVVESVSLEDGLRSLFFGQPYDVDALLDRIDACRSRWAAA